MRPSKPPPTAFRASCPGLAVALVSCLLPLTFGQQQPDPEPLDVGLEEQVEVQFILVDVVAVDRRGRTVPDLEQDDFGLYVDGKRTEIDSLDVVCPLGAEGDPRAGEVPSRWEAPAGMPARTRRIVLAFDYLHMPLAVETLGYAIEAIRKQHAEGVEHMVVAIGEGVRIELPFTEDREALLETLIRMENDPTLFAGNYFRLTETRTFQKLQSLMDLMETLPGRKIMLLFTGPFRADGFFHDPAYKRLGALAARSRTAIYPVDSRGIHHVGPISSPRLARLATETGGRLTSNTNDLTVGYARAQRDLGCTYTLGFRDRQPRADRSRRVRVEMLRPGVRAHHPAHYVVRSDREKRTSLTRTAAMVPEFFGDGGVESKVFLVGPRSKRKWEAAFAVAVPPSERKEPGDAAAWELRGMVRAPSGAVLHRFSRKPQDVGEQRVLVERFPLRAGSYRFSAAFSSPGRDEPWVGYRDLEAPAIPAGRPILVGPVLGRLETPAGEKDVLGGFRPLLSGRVRRGDPLISLVRVCVVGDRPVSKLTLQRELTDVAGRAVHVFERQAVSLVPGERCRTLTDELATSSLSAGRYTVRAWLGEGGQGHGGARESFTLLPDENQAQHRGVARDEPTGGPL